MKKEIIKRIFSYIKQDKMRIFVSLLSAAISVIAMLIIPVLVGKSIDKMIGCGRVDFSKITTYLLLIGAFIVIYIIFYRIMTLSNNRLVYKVSENLRKDAVEKLEKLKLKYLDERSTGDILSVITADVEIFSEGLQLFFTSVFTGTMTLVCTTCIMFMINVNMALIVVCVSPLAVFITWFISKNTYKYFKKTSTDRGDETALIEESITGLEVVAAYNAKDTFLNKFDNLNNKLKFSGKNSYFFSSLPNPTSRFVYSVIYALLACGGTLFVLKGSISVGDFISFLAYANQFTRPFNELTDTSSQMQNALVCAKRVFDIIDEDGETPDKSPAYTIDKNAFSIEFKNVSFAYKAGENVIKNFNLKVENGQKIAIVGPTGCGKTTLINLLMRFYDVTDGEILINGVNINDMKRDYLRGLFGMVLQDTWIKDGTIKENISFGRPDASDEEIKKAAQMSFADSFIVNLKNGYNTVISEEGGSLSQGQKQLLNIARVMLVKPPMLILDEATSSIDTRTEKKVQEAFDVLMQGRTSIVVAHRLSTIQNADLIVVMKDGEILEKGRHDELIRQGGFYSSLYYSQF